MVDSIDIEGDTVIFSFTVDPLQIIFSCKMKIENV